MKKIYFAAVMALSAAMAGAMNNTTLKHVGHTLHEPTNQEKGIVFNPSKAPSLDAKTIKSIAAKTGRLNTSSLSRAEESEPFNFTDYYLWTFFDPDVNFYDDNGYQLSNITNYISSTQTIMQEVGDSIEINWYYYEDVPYKFYVTQNDESHPVIKLGQKIVDRPVLFYYTENGIQKEISFNMYLGAAFLVPDPDNPDSDGNLVFATDGDVQFYMDPNDSNVISTDAVALYVLVQDANDPTAEMEQFHAIMLSQLCKPNATIGYEFQYYDNNNEPVVDEVNVPAYYSFQENSYAPFPEEPNTFYDSYFISNVTPYGMGIGVNIARFEVEEEYSPTGFMWMAYDQPAYPSRRISGNSFSGKLYMNSVYVQGDIAYFYDPSYPQVSFTESIYKDINGKEYKAFVFPGNVPDCDDEMSLWGLSSKVQDVSLGYYSTAVIVFDFVGNAFTAVPDDPAGIQDVIQDTYEGAVEYYDLQGIKVANPAPGRIYIVKEGSKVTKRIF